MMLASEDSRLAVLESQYDHLQRDVTEIKVDVKGLVHIQADLATALAVKTASENTEMRARASTGVWARALLPWITSAVAVVVALVALAAR